jgi:hypothetical protein
MVADDRTVRTLKGISIMDAAPVYQPLSGFEK